MEYMKSDLTPELLEDILHKLGLDQPPATDLPGLARLYSAWCTKVPFDNIQKRIHLAGDNPQPLPGDNDTEFFTRWLKSGLGGLCWAGNAALHSLLCALGFSANLATATMLTGSHQPPNHGTVVVDCEEHRFLVDASMLHTSPLLLHRAGITYLEHAAWGLSCKPEDETWMISWRPLHMLLGCKCRLEELSVSRDEFRRYNEVTRTVSPFNDALYIRINTERGVHGIRGSLFITLTEAGDVTQKELTATERNQLLVETFGIDKDIVRQIPAEKSAD